VLRQPSPGQLNRKALALHHTSPHAFHPHRSILMAAPASARRDRITADFPKLVEMTHQYVYGDVWERPQLSKRDRSMVTIAALVALGWEDQLNSHMARGLGNGLTQEEISEIVTHLAMYSGWPSAMTAAHVAVDVFEAAGKTKG